MTLNYRSGEEIQRGDRVRFHGNPAVVELVASDYPLNPASGYLSESDEELAWYAKEFGGGVLIFDPLVSGRTFIPVDELTDYEDLEFVSRGQT